MNPRALGVAVPPVVLGAIAMDRVLYEYDGPRTFVGRSTSLGEVLAHLAAEDDDGLPWFFVAPSSSDIVTRLLAGALSVREALTATCLWLARLSDEGEVLELARVDTAEVDFLLPRPGVMLYAHLQPALSLRFAGRDHWSEVPAELLQSVVAAATGAVRALAEQVLRRGFGADRWPTWASSLWSLNAREVAFASVRVSFGLGPGPAERDAMAAEIAQELQRALLWARGGLVNVTPAEEATFAEVMELLTPPLGGEVECVEVSGRLAGGRIPRVQTRSERARVVAARRRVLLRQQAATPGGGVVNDLAEDEMSEWTQVEQPLIDQLLKMGWRWITGNLDEPTVTGRSTFREVMLEGDLRRALRKINRNPEGEEWLDDARLDQAVSALTRLNARGLMEANKAAMRLLLEGTTVDGVEGWEGGRGRTVQFIDWEQWDNNDFLVINQFRVDEPGGQAKAFVLPDAVLFVNGIPLVVVECKAPLGAPAKAKEATQRKEIVEAVDQLRRYSNQRARFQQDEGNETLFHTNQFLIATCYDEARVGTIGASVRHFLEWKDTSPVPSSTVAAGLGKDSLSSQEKLVAGMLRPEHLLDIVRHFILYKDDEEGRTIKLVCRYQQFRAVHATLKRLREGRRRGPGVEVDERGGIIWHTQGSGKSLTMVFLIRKMRSMFEFQPFKVVVVTDRSDLQAQLAETAALTNETPKIARKVKHLAPLLGTNTPDLVFAMIQKYQEGDRVVGEDEDEDDEGAEDEAATFPLLNPSGDILVLVDEAHRSHGSGVRARSTPKANGEQSKAGLLHMNLRQALPNAALIGFTGTPIVMGAKKKTHEIFGPFIDKYTIRQSEEDGATVPILYEGRAQAGEVRDGKCLDQVFPDLFKDRSPEEIEALKQRYATKGYVQEAEKLIAEKAADMLLHYVESVLPNGFKAQVVAYSRRGAVRYQAALVAARDALVAAAESGEPDLVPRREGVALDRTAALATLARIQAHLPQVRALKFEAVISAANTNEDPGWVEWTDDSKNRDRIKRFKRPLGTEEGEKSSPLAFLIVKSMLLTGFDAPLEQVLYLDRGIKEAELLQTIARVNRAGPARKRVGMVVDYYGVAGHLDEALNAYYEAEDIDGALRSFQDDLPRLRDLHLAAVGILEDRDLDIHATEDCVVALADAKLRAAFEVKLKQFISALDAVLPRLEAVEYLGDAQALVEILAEAKRRYRDGGRPAVDPEDGAKVAALLDKHLISKGIDVRIPPIDILDADFGERVSVIGSNRAKASEMEHAARHHIKLHLNEDPVRYEALSKRLESILQEFAGRWEDLVRQLSKLVGEIREGRQADDTGLDPKRQLPYFEVLKRAAYPDSEPTGEARTKLIAVTVDMVDHIEQESATVDFWRNVQAQKVLRASVLDLLDDADVVPFSKLDELADRVLELARARRVGSVRG